MAKLALETSPKQVLEDIPGANVADLARTK